MNELPPHPPQQKVSRLFDLVCGAMTVQALWVAAELGLADNITEQPQSIEALAQATQSNPQAVARLLRTLANQGIFAVHADGTVSNNELSTYLRSDNPQSLREYLRVSFGPWSWSAIGNLEHSIRSGEPAFAKTHGVDFWNFLGQNPQLAVRFSQSMTGMSNIHNDAIAESYDFSGCQRIVDLGGAQGSLLIAILKRNPTLQGILFDTPEVIAGAPDAIAQSGVQDRITLQGGSFFDTIPADTDVYLLRYVLHDWDDAKCVDLLQRCKQTNPNARVLVLEQILQPTGTPAFTHVMDLYMLLLFGSQERTQEDYERLLRTAGYQVKQVLPTSSPVRIIEAIPS